MNLYLHDIETFSIRRGDTLRQPKFREPDGSLTQFDAVIANPPFSLKNWGRPGWADDPFGRSLFGVPPESYADLAFVEHMLCSMRRGPGRVAVVMPHGALFRGGVEQQIRRAMLEAGLLEAVVGLPANLFYSTNIPAVILVFRSVLDPGRRGHVLFVDGSACFFKGPSQNEMSSIHIERVVEGYRTGQDQGSDTPVHVRLVPINDIAAANWDLNMTRYVTVEAAADVEMSVALEEYRAARGELREAETLLDTALRAAGLDD
jgi:type I restriction enzyme M protein